MFPSLCCIGSGLVGALVPCLFPLCLYSPPVLFPSLRNEINEQARHSRGTELPGTVNQFVVGSLFRDQAESWNELAAMHLNNSWAAANYFICQAVRHLSDEQTYSRIVEAYVHPEMERLNEALITKLSELTLSIERHHPLPVENSHLEKIRKPQHARQLAQLKSNLGFPNFPSALNQPRKASSQPTLSMRLTGCQIRVNSRHLRSLTRCRNTMM